MARGSHDFPWCFAVCLIAACWLLGDLSLARGPLHRWLEAGKRAALRGKGGEPVAEVCGRSLTRLELEEALREHLWQRHESWAALDSEARGRMRRLVLDNLVNDHVLRTSRIMSGLWHAPSADMVRREADGQRRQFPDAAEYSARLAAQLGTEKSQHEAIREAQLDEAWIAEKTASRLKEVTEREARAWYAEFKEMLRIPAAWHVAHLFLTRHDKGRPDRGPEIRELHGQLMSGQKSFVALVAEHSEDERTKKIGGDLGWFTERRMPQDFMKEVRKLMDGTFSAPVLTRLGWHIILVKERRDSRLPAFAEVRAEILAMLTSQWREKAVGDLVAALRARESAPSVLYHPEVIDRTNPAP